MMESELMDKLSEGESFEDTGGGEFPRVPENTLSQEELLRQFHYVKRLTKGFISITWVVLISYFAKNGVAWLEWAVMALFLVVTVQLWNMGPQK